MTYWILKRVYSKKVGKHRQPYVWKPQKRFHIITIPTSRLGWEKFVQRIFKELGEGRYRIMRNHFRGESRGMKPVVYIDLQNGKYTITNRYTNFKAIEGELQPFFKQHERRRRMTAQERLKEMKRKALKDLHDQLPKARTSYTIQTVRGPVTFPRKRN
jgi:hypothetical protein